LVKVVLDTNILISAFLWSKKVKKSILPLIEENKVAICFSQETLNELLGVMSRKKFAPKFTKLSLTPRLLVDRIVDRENVIILKKPLPAYSEPIVEKDPSDDKFLYLAKEAKADYVVSGDKHLLSLGEFEAIKIVSVDRFLTLISSPPTS